MFVTAQLLALCIFYPLITWIRRIFIFNQCNTKGDPCGQRQRVAFVWLVLIGLKTSFQNNKKQAIFHLLYCLIFRSITIKGFQLAKAINQIKQN